MKESLYNHTVNYSYIPTCTCTYVKLYICQYTNVGVNLSIFTLITQYTSLFLISLYGAPLTQRASYLALHSSLLGPVAQLIMIMLSLTALTLS